MTLTPLTDKEAVGIIGFYSCPTVPARLARKLETENAGLRSALRDLAEIVGEYRERVIKGEIIGRLIEHDCEAYLTACKLLKESV
jgi:hypothetical protein